MNNRLAISVLALVVSAGSAFAQDLKVMKGGNTSSTVTMPQDPDRVVWGGGDPAKGSVYSAAYVPQLIKGLESERLPGYAWGGPTQGTVDNAERVTRNPTHLAVGQRDILMQLNGQTIEGAKDGANFGSPNCTPTSGLSACTPSRRTETTPTSATCSATHGTSQSSPAARSLGPSGLGGFSDRLSKI
jgi:hypothetical protein